LDIFSEEDYDIKDKKKKNFNKNFFSVNFKNISNNFLKNYIYYARSEIKCFLSNEVVEFLINTHFSSKINSRGSTKNNIRMIETIIRLCFSYTKCHLRCMVSIKDADYIFSFLNTFAFNSCLALLT
jgi:DNA replicative helicase MCM subunit Mcm2 (Cdc46/Mcm family)